MTHADRAASPDRRGGHAGDHGTATDRPLATTSTGGWRPRRLVLASPRFPGRWEPKPLGVVNNGGRRETIGLAVPDARHHVSVHGITGCGKTTLLANLALAEARAGRGVAVLDCQGDLSRNLLDRLPPWCGQRLVVVDPADTHAPPAYNPLAPTTAHGGTAQRVTAEDAEWAADTLAGVFRRLYHQAWGPRMDDLMRGSCLTLGRRPGSTLPDVVALLTDHTFRRRVLADHGHPPGMDGLWNDFDHLTPAARAQLAAPLLSRLRAVLSRRLARDLLDAPVSTINLTDILDGGILIARLPKGEIGEDTARLLGSLLVAGLWTHTTRRSQRPPEDRPDATILIDEAHNFLHLPIGMDDALAESRGYRVSWVIAHQHRAQLPADVRDAVDANARTKLLGTLSPTDAHHLAHHVRPHFDEHDLAHRPAYSLTVRTVHHGQDQAPFTLDTLPLPPPVRGRAQMLRAAARDRTGLSRATRAELTRRRRLDTAANNPLLHPTPARPTQHRDDVTQPGPAGAPISPPTSPPVTPPPEWRTDWRTLPGTSSQLNAGEEAACDRPD